MHQTPLTSSLGWRLTVSASTSTSLMPRLAKVGLVDIALVVEVTLTLSMTLWRPRSRMVERTRPASLRWT